MRVGKLVVVAVALAVAFAKYAQGQASGSNVILLMHGVRCEKMNPTGPDLLSSSALTTVCGMGPRGRPVRRPRVYVLCVCSSTNPPADFGFLEGSVSQHLESLGYTVIVTTVGPVSSVWDRVCEAFAEVKGLQSTMKKKASLGLMSFF